MKIGELTGAQREQAMTRWALLHPHLEDELALAETARQAGVPLRTAQRWLAHYRADGLVGLAGEHGWPTPSYSMVYAIVAGLDPGLVTLAHEGTKRYGEVFDLVYRRQASAPNDIWQADHTKLDL